MSRALARRGRASSLRLAARTACRPVNRCTARCLRIASLWARLVASQVRHAAEPQGNGTDALASLPDALSDIHWHTMNLHGGFGISIGHIVGPSVRLRQEAAIAKGGPADFIHAAVRRHPCKRLAWSVVDRAEEQPEHPS